MVCEDHLGTCGCLNRQPFESFTDKAQTFYSGVEEVVTAYTMMVLVYLTDIV
jgi:hypothetical protein